MTMSSIAQSQACQSEHLYIKDRYTGAHTGVEHELDLSPTENNVSDWPGSYFSCLMLHNEVR